MSLNLKLIFTFVILALWTNVGGLYTNRKNEHSRYPKQHTLGNYSSAAVTIDGKPCANIGL